MTSAFNLCLFPSAIMLMASILALSVRVPVHVVSAMQHLAAGIVLSAVAVELVPEILAAPTDIATTFGMTVGFVFGIVALLLVSAVSVPDEDNEGSEQDEDEDERDDHVTQYSAAADAADAADAAAPRYRHWKWSLKKDVVLGDALVIFVIGAAAVERW